MQELDYSTRVNSIYREQTTHSILTICQTINKHNNVALQRIVHGYNLLTKKQKVGDKFFSKTCLKSICYLINKNLRICSIFLVNLIPATPLDCGEISVSTHTILWITADNQK